MINSPALLASLVGYVSVIALFGPEFLMPIYLHLLAMRGFAVGMTVQTTISFDGQPILTPWKFCYNARILEAEVTV